MPENHKKTHADRKKHSIISITSHQPTLGHLRDTLVQHIFYYDPPMATSTLPQSRSTPSQGINVLYKVQGSLLSAIVYTAQVKNSRHPFLPGVPLPALAFVEQGHPPVINLNSSQSETFKDPKGANGFCLIGHQYMPLSLSWSGKA